MATKEEIKIIVTAESLSAQKNLGSMIKGLKTTEKQTKKTTSSFGSLLKGALAFGAVSAVFKKITKEASALEETTAKFNTVFKDVKQEAESMAKVMRDSYGQSTEESKRLLSNTGDLLTGFGFTADAALNLSFETQKLAADLASFNNLQGGAKQASEALTKAYFGERESLKQLGVIVNEKSIKDRLLANNQSHLTGNALLQAKAQITLNMAMEQSKNAIGDVSRTFDSYANVSRRTQGRIKDLAAELGTELLPSLSQLGVAFLESSKDGGVLISIFKGIIKGVSFAVQQIANLVNTFESLNRQSIAEEAVKELNFFNKRALEMKKTLIKTHGSLKNLKKLAAEGGEFSQAAHDLRAYKQALDESGRAATRSGGATKRFSDVAERLSEVEIKSAAAAIKAREKEKKLAKTGGASKKATKEKKATLIDFLNFTKNKKDAELLKEEERFTQVKKFAIANKLDLEKVETQHQENIKAIKDKAAKEDTARMLKRFSAGLTAANQVAGQISAINQQLSSNENMELQNREEAANEKLARDFEKRRNIIETTVADEAEKNRQLEELDGKQKVAQDKLNEKFEKKRRKLARDQAKREKAISIIAATINTAQAVTRALTAGPFAGPILAGVIGALGAAQIGLIAAAPLPRAEKGAMIKGSSGGVAVQAGEKNKTEAIIPLEDEESLSTIRGALGGGGITLNIENFNSFGDAEEAAIALDRALFRLAQDGNSVFAEEIG